MESMKKLKYKLGKFPGKGSMKQNLASSKFYSKTSASTFFLILGKFYSMIIMLVKEFLLSLYVQNKERSS